MNDTIHQYLAVGSSVDQFEIREILGSGGFGITYKAWDARLERDVALKEFLPTDLAIREGSSRTVKARTDRVDDYRFALDKFLQEARLLARFSHPNIVRVTQFLEANGTAYLVMDYERGRSLSDYLKSHPGPAPQETLKSWFVPILKGLVEVHKAGFLHRDIKPGNIYLRDEGEPLLIDFGAARQAIGEHSRSVTGIVSAGYAPTEQYGTDSKKQGPWTDLYALGATMYRCIAGKHPVDAPTRKDALFEDDDDPMPPAKKVGEGRYEASLLSLVDDLLNVSIKGRPQSAEALLRVLAPVDSLAADPESEAVSGTRSVSDEERAQANEKARAHERARSSTSAGGDEGSSSLSSTGSADKASLTWLATAAVLLLSAIGGGAWWLMQSNPPAVSPTGVSSSSEEPMTAVISPSTSTSSLSSLASASSALTRDELFSGAAIVDIVSEPSGAVITLDGVEIGTTPLASRELRPGDYTLRLESRYTVPLEEAVAFADNRVFSRNLNLETAMGELTALSNPAGAEILLDGESTNRRTPATLIGIDAGEHRISYRLDRHAPASETVEILPNKIAVVEATLEPISYGTLTLDVTPGDARITLPDIGPSYSPGMELPVGEYRVFVTAEKHVPQRLRLSVGKSPLTRSITLQ